MGIQLTPEETFMGSLLDYAAEASEILAFLVMLPGTCAAVRKWTRKHRGSGYRPRHAIPGRFRSRSGRHRRTTPRH